MASVRLSQERQEDAKAAILQGWSLFRELEAGLCFLYYSTRRTNFPSTDSEDYPPYSTRLSYAQRLLEVSEYSFALEVLQRLENEDDEDIEIWYLSGWSWWLLGTERGVSNLEEQESKEECWSEGKLCLENFLRVSCIAHYYLICSFTNAMRNSYILENQKRQIQSN